MEHEIDPLKFMKKVEEMRKAQRAYFQTRSKQQLIISKRLEKEVDDMINPQGPQQRALFEWLAR